MSTLSVCLLLAAALAVPGASTVSAQSASTLYHRALTRERTLRDAGARPTLTALRKAVASYERIVRRYPRLRIECHAE